MANTEYKFLQGLGQVFSLSELELSELLALSAEEVEVDGSTAIVNRVTVFGKTYILIDTGESRLAVRQM